MESTANGGVVSVLAPVDRLLTIHDDDTVYVARVPDGPIIVLADVAGVIWREACGVERASVVDRVAKVTGQRVETIRGDVERFIDSLLQEGLLTAE